MVPSSRFCVCILLHDARRVNARKPGKRSRSCRLLPRKTRASRPPGRAPRGRRIAQRKRSSFAHETPARAGTSVTRRDGIASSRSPSTAPDLCHPQGQGARYVRGPPCGLKTSWQAVARSRPCRESSGLRLGGRCGIGCRGMTAPLSAPDEHLQVGDAYYVLASSLASRRRRHILAHGDTFAVLDQTGDFPFAIDEELGLVFRGTRHLSQFELLANGRPPFFLSGAVGRDNLRAVANLTNNDTQGDGGLLTPRSTLSIRRTALLCGPQLHVRLVLHSFYLEPLPVRLELVFAADFRDVFELRGLRRARRGSLEPPCIEGDALVLAYHGLDLVRRSTRCAISGAAVQWRGPRAVLELVFAPQEERVVDIVIDCRNEGIAPAPQHGFAGAEAAREREHRLWQVEHTAVQAADEGFSAVLGQAMADVFLLTVPPEAGTLHGVDRFLYAGIPWFATVFGRDALIAARQMLLFAPGLARGVLRVLAALQGTTVNAARDEEPGKIIHEARYGEMASTGEIPFGRYYGSVDATPLFCMLLGAYARVTGDIALV